ncbi:MAG: arsenate reductase ArsC [Firmicutes bacterium]|nr:arsenate reductase ArsC [Bacillota bacterium]
MIRVLFVCVHNSARSQIGETYLNHFGENLFIAESAGLEKGTLNPLVVEAMKEEGFDISNNEINSVFDFLIEGREYSFIIKVCDELNGQRCPIFPNALREVYWNLPDPSALKGTKEEQLKQVREIRNEIKRRVQDFIEEHSEFAQLRK